MSEVTSKAGLIGVNLINSNYEAYQIELKQYKTFLMMISIN